jgi:SAM-dependent methyltransferase
MNPAEFANIAQWERDFWWYRGQRAILFRLLDPLLSSRRIARVLEAGCGTGYFSRLMQQERGWGVVPLDISAEGLKYAHAMGVERPVQADLSKLPFPGGVFDMVMSVDVLPHLPRGAEEAAMGELTRVLARGGLLVVRAAALNILRSRHSEFAFERQRFARRQMADLFRRCGIRVLRATYANSLLFPVALVKFRLWEPLLKRPAASGIAPVPPWLDALLYKTLETEASWLGTGHNFPLGQSLITIGEKL